ncbi:MAG: sulfatase [Phycisphaeraceae bacterium]|nr:sulfatase [Phycisphaeraceae bacterium]
MPSSSAPSVLLIIADDWSPIAGCYGHHAIQTPHIDALAQRGSVFDHAFCTSVSCAASRANLLTGLYTHTHGQYGHCHSVHGFRTHEFVRSLPRILKETPVRSACLGKQHFAPASVYPFDFLAAEKDNASPRALADATSSFLNQIGSASFYLHVAPSYPHREGTGFGLDRCASEFPAFRYDPADVSVPDFLPDHPLVRQDLAQYYAAISRYDHTVGQVLSALQAAGRADDTLVIVTSDHGMPFPGAKATSFDSGHHCPLIIAPPGSASAPASAPGSEASKTAGHRCQALVNWSDFMPTILDLLQVPRTLWPADLPGRSFQPLLTQPDDTAWDQTFFSHCFHEVSNYFPYRTVRQRRYKFTQHLAHQLPQPIPADVFRSPTWTAVRQNNLSSLGRRPVERFRHRDAEELIDLQADPLENRNLIHDPALQSVADSMRQALLEFRIRTHDYWLEDDFQRGHISPQDLQRARRG